MVESATQVKSTKNKPVASPNGVAVQAKLQIGAINDPLEKEADDMVERVMRMPENALTSRNENKLESKINIQQNPTNSFIQRKCTSCKDEEKLQRKPIKPFIQKKSTSGGIIASDSVSNRINATRGKGQSLPKNTRSFMESRFASDFSDVNVHTNSAAIQMSKDLGAKAFTVGKDIYFNQGQYSPESENGKRLLAHELTHTIQQDGSDTRISRSAESCISLLNQQSLQGTFVRAISGTAIHAALAIEFSSVPGSLHIAIPGGSATPLRTQGLCGEDSTIINPQITGGRAGTGFPDLAKSSASVLEIAELKPASYGCVIDGEEQLARYLLAGNAMDPFATAWRTSLGLSAVIPMSPETFTPQDLIIGNYRVTFAWCGPGLIVYQVIGSQPDPIPVPHRVRVPEHETNWEKIKQFTERVIQEGLEVEVAVRTFLRENPELVDFVIAAGIAVIVATIIEDIATAGVGIIDDFVMIPIAATMIRVAYMMRNLAPAVAPVLATARAIR